MNCCYKCGKPVHPESARICPKCSFDGQKLSRWCRDYRKMKEELDIDYTRSADMPKDGKE